MKRIISLIIVLCLILGSFSFVFAEAWTTTDVYQQQQKLSSILNYVLSIDSKMPSLSSSGMSVFESIDLRLGHLEDWFVPSGSRPSNYATLMDSIVVLADTVMNNLPGIYSYINGYFGTYSTQLTTQSGYLNTTRQALGNILNVFGGTRYSISSIYNSAHTGLFSFDANNTTSSYYMTNSVGANGAINNYGTYWNSGTALGNIALLLKYTNDNIVKSYSYRWAADLTHYNDNLTTWDSQGDTLQQVAFTPESAIQGLYRYLAFTQRDVARLTYVLASDEEIEAREEARANQTEVFDNFIDPNGSGSASVNDFADVSSASGNVKQNFSTGYSASSIWDIFNQDHYGWFSQECADALDTTNTSSNMRKSNNNDYPTPLLDAYYEEILSLGGVKDD